MISGADLGGRGNLNCPQARRSPTPAPGSRRRNLLEATRALTGCRSFFQQAAPGAACFLHSFAFVRELFEALTRNVNFFESIGFVFGGAWVADDNDNNIVDYAVNKGLN
jgi:hypothetical protein